MRNSANLLRKCAKVVLVFGASSYLSISTLSAQPECGDAVTADGKVFYRVSAGELVARDVAISVPACGQGSVVLSSASGWSAETEAFFVKKVHDRSIFYVVFQDPKADNPSKYLLLKGSYLRGTNVAGYWGDIYSIVWNDGKLETPADAELIANLEEQGSVKHVGGFAFHADVKAP